MDQIQYHYIDADGQQHGPVSFDELESAVPSGGILAQTLVWQPEWPDWRPASSVPGLFNDVAPPTVAPPRVVPVCRTPWGIPAMPAKFYPPDSFMTLYWCWLPLSIVAQIILFIGAIMMFGTSYTANQSEVTNEMMIGFGVICGGFLIQIPAIVIICYLIYRAWRQIQDGHAETSPGKAIGFYFIPIFNIYWQFVMYWGLAKDLRSYAERYGVEGVRVSSGFALGVVITTTVGSVLAGCLGVFGIPIAFIASVLMMVLTYQIALSSRAVAQAGERGVGFGAVEAGDPSRATLNT